MALKSILVVDDDADLRENIAMALEMEGYVAFKAANGWEALAFLESKAKDHHIGCIILDMMMPEMNGKTFLEILNLHHPNDLAKIPIILATAQGAHKNAEPFEGTVATLYKPMELTALFTVVAKYCGPYV